MPIREVGRSGKRKNPRGRRKKRKKARVERLGSRLKHKLSANHPGAELGIRVTGVELPAMSPHHVGFEPKSSAPATMAPS